MELAIGLVIGFIIGAGVVFLIFDRLMTRLTGQIEKSMKIMEELESKY